MQKIERADLVQANLAGGCKANAARATATNTVIIYVNKPGQ